MLKRFIKRLRKNAMKSRISTILLPSSGKVERDIRNFTNFEISSKFIDAVNSLFSSRVPMKIWYYVGKSEENPGGQRKECIVRFPKTEKKPLGYIEKDTENVFLTTKSKSARKVYAISSGKVFHMKDFSPETTNQEVKDFLRTG